MTTLTARASVARTVHVERCMGTAFTIDVRDPGEWHSAIGDVVAWLHHVDAVFSTYRPDSAICRLQRGELRLAECPDEVREVLEECAEVTRCSDGAFTAVPDGRLDPSALVKGWAVERASDLLRRQGSDNHAVSGGGDMQLAGEAAPDQPWRVGVSAPHDSRRLVAVVSGRDIAVATSGTAQRGAHIVDPFTGRPASGLVSVTVVGPRLGRVDAYATAAFVMGARAGEWVASLPGHAAMGVALDGSRWCTPGFPFADA